MKFTKTHQEQIAEFLGRADESGCLAASEWTNGSGRYTTKKALPPFVERFERRPYSETNLPSHGTTERIAYNYLNAKENSRKKCVLVMDKSALCKFLFGAAHGKEF